MLIHYTHFLILLFYAPCLMGYQHELAICAIFQNEGRFLKEWIEFHKLIGVQHFYLYNHNSTDNYQEILHPYIEAADVDLIDWSNKKDKITKSITQVNAYNHCLATIKNTVKWIAFIDVDEFLYPVHHNDLRTFLKEYEPYGALCVNWIMFGTSDIDFIPENKLSLELLTMRSHIDDPINKHVKSIIQPKRVIAMNAHAPTHFYPNFFQVTADQKPFSGPFSPSVAIDKIRINHYWTRDKAWLYETKIPRLKQRNCSTEWVLAHASRMNKEKDTTIQRFVDNLKKIFHYS